MFDRWMGSFGIWEEDSFPKVIELEVHVGWIHIAGVRGVWDNSAIKKLG